MSVKKKTISKRREMLDKDVESAMPEAILFAFNAHFGQYRKLSPEQYIIHPMRVSEFLLKHFSHRKNIDELRVAGVLHDIIEDTWVKDNDISERFGSKIATLVREVSHSDIEDKKERHYAFIASLKMSSDDAKILKIADIYDNVTGREGVWKIFLIEKEEMLRNIELKESDKKFSLIKEELLDIIRTKLDKIK